MSRSGLRPPSSSVSSARSSPGGPKPARRRHVRRERPIARPRHVPRLRVDRLLLASVAGRGAHVDEQVARGLPSRDFARRDDAAVARSSWLVTPRANGRRLLLLDGQAGFLPSCETAVENRAPLVAEPAEQPPKTRGDGAAALVVGDDRVAGAECPNRRASRRTDRDPATDDGLRPRAAGARDRRRGARSARRECGRGRTPLFRPQGRPSVKRQSTTIQSARLSSRANVRTSTSGFGVIAAL